MLSKQELENLKQLLESPDMGTFDLGLAILTENSANIEYFMPILSCQKLLLAPAISLTDFIKEQRLKDKFYDWEIELILLEWTLSGKKWLLDTKKRNKKSYDNAKINFLTNLDEIENCLLKSKQAETIYNTLSSHFLQEDNDYILATHFSAAVCARSDSYQTMVQLSKLLIYYHFPQGSLLKLRPKVEAWIENFKVKCLSNIGKKSDEWYYFFICWLQGLLDEALGQRQKTAANFIQLLTWADERPHLLDSGEQVYGDIYQCLGCWAAESGDLKTAKSYYMKLKMENKEKRFIAVKANILILENKIDKAIAILFEGIKSRPVTESYYVLLAKIYAAQGKYGQAAETLVNCIEHSPQYKIHIFKLIEYLDKTKFYAKVDTIAHYQKVIADIDSSLEELEDLF